MGVNIGSSMGAYRSYTNNANSLARSTRNLSSGYRINSAADDAAGLAISEKMRSQITYDQTRLQNTQMEINVAQTGDGALSSVHESLGRMRQLAAQASNGAYSDEDRAVLQKEFSQLREEIGRIYEGTNFNGKAVLSGAPDLSSFDISSQDGAFAAIDGIAEAINSVSSQRADFGAQQNRAEYTADGLMTSIINTQDAESRIRDVDYALEIMENTKKSILAQASTAMLAQANQRAHGVLKLLQ